MSDGVAVAPDHGVSSRTLVVGLGNPILGDDGVGWRVAEEVRARLTDPDVTVTCLALGRALGAELPEEVWVVAVEAERLYEFSDTLSPPVAAAVPEAVRCVEAWLAGQGLSGPAVPPD